MAERSHTMTFHPGTLFWLLSIAWIAVLPASGAASPVRSATSGRWSEPSTWEHGRIPAAGDRVTIRPGHAVTFDGRVATPIRSIRIAGTLEFDPDRDTLLTVGLIEIGEAGSGPEGHERMGEMGDAGPGRASLLVGKPGQPISVGHTATIRLAMVEGLDPEDCPAIVCHGGRMEFHGAPVGPTWVKLAETVKAGGSSVRLSRPVEGWKSGDRVIVTATRRQYDRNEALTPKVLQEPRTEERIIRAIEGATLTLDAPLVHPHLATGDRRGEVALLSRNVVVESADPGGVRGHTMFHRGSLGSISFAEFRHLGKPGKLGKYSLHFHRAGDTMRGSSVIGASIWDSGNRWITIHGTNDLVVRDCVGYRSAGHGFFLEDGTEVDNILDGNLAVQATSAPPLPGQLIGHDGNDGAGFWWANNRNAFTRNVAVECDGYGFRFEAPGPKDGPPGLGEVHSGPFIRFEGNEAHAQRRYGVNLGAPAIEGPTDVVNADGPDSRHPMVVRGLRIWDCHWGFSPATPGLLVDGLDLAHCDYAISKANFDRQAYRGLTFHQCGKRYAEIKGPPPDQAIFPRPLDPVDDRPPVSVITSVEPVGHARFRVSGSSTDDGPIKVVRVNGVEARPLHPDFSRWEATLELIGGAAALTATAEDAAGHVEPTPHVVKLAESPPASGPAPARRPTHSSVHPGGRDR